MDDIMIKEKVELIKQGATELKQELYSHYYEKYYRYVEKNRDIENIEELYENFMILCIDNYFENDYSSIISDCLRRRLETATEKKNFLSLNNPSVYPKGKVTIMIEEAIDNDKKLEELTKRYMYLAEKYALSIDTTLDREDVLQIGYFYLVKKMGQYLKGNSPSQIFCYLNATLKRDITGAIRREEEKESEYHEFKNNAIPKQTEYIGDIEILDFIENNKHLNTKDKLISYKLALGQTQSEIAEDFDLTRAAIGVRIGKVRKRLKTYYSNK